MLRVFTAMLIAATMSVSVQAREQLRIVGSSTVFPFVAAAAEQYSEKSGDKAPIVESIGTGAGMIEFCKGIGVQYPDMVNASRQMKDSERKICLEHGVKEITELPIGMDGIVIAGSTEQEAFNLTLKDLFLALAKQVPVNGELADNPYTRWTQINKDLPDVKIEMYGPKSTSGTRDAFVEMVMEVACIDVPEFVKAYPEKKFRKHACHTMREDGAYIEAGENDNLIVQKLALNPKALGIFGYSYLEQNSDKVLAHPIEGVEPEFELISDGSYPVARSLFVYLKNAHVAAVKGLKPFAQELVSEDAVSEDGYLSDKGLISHTDEKQTEIRAIVEKL